MLLITKGYIVDFRWSKSLAYHSRTIKIRMLPITSAAIGNVIDSNAMIRICLHNDLKPLGYHRSA